MASVEISVRFDRPSVFNMTINYGRKLLFLLFSFTVLQSAVSNGEVPLQASRQDEHKTLAIGAPAPDFRLPGVDGKTYTLRSFQNAKILAVVFMCNHCPTSQAYEKRIHSNDHRL